MKNFSNFLIPQLMEYAEERIAEIRRNDYSFYKEREEALMLYEQFQKQLSPEQNQLFIKLDDLNLKQACENDRQLYCYGIQDCVDMLKFLHVL